MYVFSLYFALNLIVLFIVAAKTKRQPWDLKGKMEDMQGEMRTAIERIMALETEKTTLQTNVEEKTVVVAQNSEELDAQKRQCKQLNEELDDLRRKMRKMQVCTSVKVVKFMTKVNLLIRNGKFSVISTITNRVLHKPEIVLSNKRIFCHPFFIFYSYLTRG